MRAHPGRSNAFSPAPPADEITDNDRMSRHNTEPAPRWITAFLDTPPPTSDAAEQFWTSVTGSTLSSRRDQGRFVTLAPPRGDAYLRGQVIDDGPATIHVDLHVDDVESFSARAQTIGARPLAAYPGLHVLHSPGGLAFCVKSWHGEHEIPPIVDTGRARQRVDQVCLDIPADHYDDEAAFWGYLLRSHAQTTSSPGFRRASRPDLPVCFLFQRLDEHTGPTRAHLDLSAGPTPSDLNAAIAAHVAAGARPVRRHQFWQVMADPAGREYCLTMRDPATGRLAAL